MKTDKIRDDKSKDDISISWFGPYIKKHLKENDIQVKDFVARLETSRYRYIGTSDRIYRILEGRTDPTLGEMYVIIEVADVNRDKFFENFANNFLQEGMNGHLKYFKPLKEDNQLYK